MADEHRWSDERDREWRERYRRENERTGERAYGAGEFEQARYGRYYDMPDDRRGQWPGYQPGHDSPAYRDRSAGAPWRDRAEGQASAGRVETDYDGWDAPFGGKPIGDHEHGPWDRLVQEGRSFFDRTREELTSLFRGEDGRERRPDQGDFRGYGPRNYKRSDERILDDVNDRLTEDAQLDASRIDVRVLAGEVTLDGQVRSRADKRRAEDIVERITGVGHVQNNLRADPDSSAGERESPPIL